MRETSALDRSNLVWGDSLRSAWPAVMGLVLMLVGSLLILALPAHVFAAVGLAIVVGLILIVHPRTYLEIYLATGGLSLAIFASDRRAFLRSFGGMEPDGLRLLAFSAGSLLLIFLRPQLMVRISRHRIALSFLLILALSLLYSPNRVEGARLLLKICFPLFIYVLVLSEVRTEAHLRALLRACLWGMPIGITLTVIRFATGGGLFIVDSAGSSRLQGPMGAGTLAFYCTCLAFLFYAYGTMKGRRYGSSIFVAFALASIVVATGTRVAVAGFLAGLMMIEGVRGRVKRGVMLGAAAAVLIALFSPIVERFSYSRNIHDLATLQIGGGFWESLAMVNTSGRDMIWRRVWEELILTSPIFGHGIGSANHYLTTLLGTAEGAVPHNEILRVLADTGLIGGVVGLVLAVKMAKGVWANSLPENDAYEFLRPLAIAAFASVVVCSLTDNTLEFYSGFTGYVAAFAALLHVRVRQLAQGSKSLP